MLIQNGVFPIIVLIFVVVICVDGQPISSSALENMGFLQRDTLTNVQRNHNQLIPFGDNVRKNNRPPIMGGKRRWKMEVS